MQDCIAEHFECNVPVILKSMPIALYFVSRIELNDVLEVAQASTAQGERKGLPYARERFASQPQFLGLHCSRGREAQGANVYV